MAINPYVTTSIPTAQSFLKSPVAPREPLGYIADVAVRPTNSIPDQFEANLLSDGRIVQKSLNGDIVVGNLNTNGDYYLANGIRGNTFEDGLVIVRDFAQLNNPFAQALKVTERLRAMKGSEIPRIRQNLTNQGLNGAGLTIGNLDMREEKPDGSWQVNDHGRAVTTIIKDPVWGIAPSATVADCGLNTKVYITKHPKTDNAQAFNAELINNLCRNYQIRIQQIQSLIQARNPSLRVLSDTQSPGRTTVYDSVWNDLNKKDENGAFQYPALRAGVFGVALHGAQQQQQDAMVNYLDQLLDNNLALSSMHNQYIEATRQAAQAGLTIVVAAMNQRGTNIVPYHKPGSEMGDFAKSPYVISVAACNTHQSPGNHRAYKIAPFSSRGDGYLWNPTIAAPGAELPTSFQLGSQARNYTLEGTSFAAPYVCGVIAMMLQRNPFLNFEQIKAKLQATATSLTGFSLAEQGAGVVNPEGAVLG